MGEVADFLSRLENSFAFFDRMAPVLVRDMRADARAGKTPDGKAFRPLTLDWVRRKKKTGGKTGFLEYRERLLAGMGYVTKGPKFQAKLSIGPGRAKKDGGHYARVQQEGHKLTDAYGIPGRTVVIPPRPYVGMSAQSMSDLLVFYQAYLDGHFGTPTAAPNKGSKFQKVP